MYKNMMIVIWILVLLVACGDDSGSNSPEQTSENETAILSSSLNEVASSSSVNKSKQSLSSVSNCDDCDGKINSSNSVHMKALSSSSSWPVLSRVKEMLV